MTLVNIPDMELLRVGEWKASTGDITFTEQDIRDIIASQAAPDVKEPRLILGHTGNEMPASTVDGFFGEQPSIGKFTNLRASSDGQTLMGDLVGVPKWLADILPTAYANRSVEVYWDVPSSIPNAKAHAAVMPRVALLGINLPAVATLDDLKVLFSDEGPELAEEEADLAKATRHVAASRGDAMPQRVAASVQYEDVRRDFYNNFATEASGRYWWWINAMYVDPPLLIVDDDEEGLWSVPYSVKGDEAEFGEPTRIKVQYVEEESGKVAASAVAVPGKQFTKAASRPNDRERKETKAMGLDIAALRSRTGLTAEQLPDDATDEQINKVLAAAPEGGGEEKPPEEKPAEDKPSEEKSPEEKPADEPAGGVQASGVTVDREAWEATQRRINELEGDLKTRTAAQREDRVKAAVKAGKIPRSRIAHYTQLMEKDPDGTAEFLDGLEPTIPVDQREVGADDGGTSAGESTQAAGDYDLSWLSDAERARVIKARAGEPVETPRLVLEG